MDLVSMEDVGWNKYHLQTKENRNELGKYRGCESKHNITYILMTIEMAW